MTTTDDLKTWTREASMVMHLPTGTIGVANKFYDGVVEKFTDAAGSTVEAPVIVLDQHSFIAKKPEIFLRLPEHAAEFLVSFAEGLGQLVKSSAPVARSKGIDPDTAIKVMVSVLREQVRQLDPGTRSVPQ